MHETSCHRATTRKAQCFVPAPIKAAKPFLYSTLREAIERHGGAAKERRNGTVLFSRLPFPFCHGSAARLLGELVGGRDEAAAARARLRRRPPRGGAVLLRAQGRAREQVPGRRVGPAGVRARLRPGGPRRPPRGAQHARRPGLGVPVVDHGRRAARRRVHGAALPLPGLRHLLLRRRRQGLHGRRHLPRPRQLHPRARHRALRHPPPPRPQHHVPVLRRPGEAAPAAAGHLRHHRVHQHVDPQHGVHRHDGAGGDGDPAAVPARPAGVRRRRRRPGAPALLQGAGARHHVRVHHRRHGDADGHGRQHHPGGDVVHLLPGPAPHHLQLLDVLRAPHGARPVRGALGHALPHVLHQEHREGALRVPRQESPQEGAQPNGSDGVCREDGFGRLWGSHCPMDDPEPDGRHPWVGSPLRRQSWGWDSHYPDDDAAVHHPERQERRREAHGLGQVPEAAVAHHPAPRRGLRHRRRVQVQRPHGHPLLRAGLPEGRAGAGHRARGLRLQRPHHRVHLRRRHHHAGAAAAGRAGQVHRRAPAAAHGPRHRRRAALVPAAHRDAGERRRVQHRVHHHQGHGAHWNAVEARRRCSTHDSAANVRFSGFWHGFRSCKNVSGTQLLQAFLFKRRILFSSNLAGVNLIPTKFLQVLIHDCSFLEHFNLQTVGCLEVHSLVGRSVFLYRGMSVPMPHEGYGVVFFASAPT